MLEIEIKHYIKKKLVLKFLVKIRSLSLHKLKDTYGRDEKKKTTLENFILTIIMKHKYIN